MMYLLFACLFIALCALAASIYAITEINTMADGQGRINDWAEDVFCNHKAAIEQQQVFLQNHKDRIVELYEILRVDQKTVLQKFDESYSGRTQ